jgi:hypothetical protein
MDIAYTPEMWRDLYVMLGTSSAALIGLLFVASSLHLDEIMEDQTIRFRARYNTLHLLTLLVEAVAILTPQPMPILGVELIAINLVGIRVPFTIVYKYHYKPRLITAGGITVFRSLPYFVAYSFGIAGGVALVERSNWGLYPVTVSYVILLVAIVLNAWGVLLGAGQMEKAGK